MNLILNYKDECHSIHFLNEAFLPFIASLSPLLSYIGTLLDLVVPFLWAAES